MLSTPLSWAALYRDGMDEIAVAVHRGDFVLTDGGVETRIMFDDTVPMDPVLGSASLLDTSSGLKALTAIFGGYLEDARSFGIPSVLGTPTFRASERWICAASGHNPAMQLPKSAAAARMASAVISGLPDAPDWPLQGVSSGEPGTGLAAGG